jgi:hypothetical protein
VSQRTILIPTSILTGPRKCNKRIGHGAVHTASVDDDTCPVPVLEGAFSINHGNCRLEIRT